MKKIKTFFKNNTGNIVLILIGLPLPLFIILVIYSLFTKGLPEDLKNTLYSIDLFSVFVGIFITIGINAFFEIRKKK